MTAGIWGFNRNDWTKDKTLHFIELLKQNSCIWQGKSKEYKMKNIRFFFVWNNYWKVYLVELPSSMSLREYLFYFSSLTRFFLFTQYSATKLHSTVSRMRGISIHTPSLTGRQSLPWTKHCSCQQQAAAVWTNALAASYTALLCHRAWDMTHSVDGP